MNASVAPSGEIWKDERSGLRKKSRSGMRLTRADASAAEDMWDRPCWRMRPPGKSRLRHRLSISGRQAVMRAHQSPISHGSNGAAERSRLPAQFPVAAGELGCFDHAMLARR